MAASTTSLPSTLTLPLFILILLLFNYTSSGSSMAIGSSRNLQAASVHKQTDNTQKNQIPNCSEIVAKSHCSSNPKCRWCRSDVLDSTCSTTSDAWRFPSQIFICD
ncbi:hypothetical protein SOVF_079290 [Spinacia oleracea]|nr:hypothetical protein SOVF_079290 [Spinacia oleracea]